MKKRTKESLFAGAFLGSLAVLFFLRFGLSPEYIKVMGFSCILVAVGLIDFETYEIPDAFHVAAMGWWLLFHLIQGDSFFFGLVQGVVDGLWISASLFVFTLIGDKLAQKETMGGGDIKLFFVTGMYLGWEVNLLNLIISCVIGILFFLFSGKSKISFGPAIGISTCFCMLCGEFLVEQYLKLFW